MGKKWNCQKQEIIKENRNIENYTKVSWTDTERGKKLRYRTRASSNQGWRK